MTKIENIKVAVRVRPFKKREESRKSKCIISMVRNSTLIQDPANMAEPRPFTFDFSYWSHCGYRRMDDGYLEAADRRYADQKRVFSDLGLGLLDNAWLGYNCALFAYGQTGSGKTYTMMGNGSNKGIIPRLCETLFENIGSKNTKSSVIYQVSISMLEIYNEKVFDLLRNSDEDSNDRGLRVRMSPKYGFYVERLTARPVAKARDIEYQIDSGNKKRTLAATRMNDTSSRAHTIVILSFIQNFIHENKTKQSKIYMVDLAGSERACQTGTTGVRFEESKNINKSLLTLGTVIKNLCANVKEKSSQGPIPHRDSKLTMLLKDAIGGNSRTIMIATLSPAEEDFTQTMSTLRYAERVKTIKNKIKVNVCRTDNLIKELLAEKEALLARLTERSIKPQGYTEQEIKRLKKEQEAEIEMIKNEKVNLESSWKKRLEEATKELEEQIASERREVTDRGRIPHLWNLNEDPTLSGKVFHFIPPGEPVTVGNSRAEVPNIIELHGPSIAKEHAVLLNKASRVTLIPKQGQIRINGQIVSRTTDLSHQDRVFFNANNLFVFNNPIEDRKLKAAGKIPREITYDMAQDEMGKHSVITDEVDANLKLEVAEMLSLTHEANAMASILKRAVVFEPIVIAKLVLGQDVRRSQVFIRVRTDNGGEFIWSRDHFLDRMDLMTDMYQKNESGESDWEPKVKTQDPFWEPLETPTLIGVAYLPLESIAYMLGIGQQKIGIYDYQAAHTGYLTVALVPCTETEEECLEGLAVEDPTDLVGQNIVFKVKISGATGIPQRFKSSWCHYTFYTDTQRYHTNEVTGMVPKYNFEHTHSLTKASLKSIQYMEEKVILLEVYGRQKGGCSRTPDLYYDAYTLHDRRRSNHVVIPVEKSQASSSSLCSVDKMLREEKEKDGRKINAEITFRSQLPKSQQDTSSISLEDDIMNSFLDDTGPSDDDDSSSFNKRHVVYRQMREGISTMMHGVLGQNQASGTSAELTNNTDGGHVDTGLKGPIYTIEEKDEINKMFEALKSHSDELDKTKLELTSLKGKVDNVYNAIGSRDDELALDIRYILEN